MTPFHFLQSSKQIPTTAWLPMESAPRDGSPILALCLHSVDPYFDPENNKWLTTYAAHAEDGGHASDGPHVVVWGGGFDESTYENPHGASLPDWWFLNSTDFEVAANPVAWMPVPVLNAGLHPHLDLAQGLCQIYEEATGLSPKAIDEDDLCLCAKYITLMGGAQPTLAHVRSAIQERPYIATRIKERVARHSAFDSAAILLPYTLAKKFPAQVASEWPSRESVLSDIYSDLGMAGPF